MSRSLPRFRHMPLGRVRQPFDHPEWIFELKYDGFRALAYVDRGQVELISRKGIRYKSFPKLEQWIGAHAVAQTAVLDGEIVCLDENGCSQFRELRFRRAEARFVAFDVLYRNGEDLRLLPLMERKRVLRQVIPDDGRSLLFAE